MKRWRWYPGERVSIEGKTCLHGTVLKDHFGPEKSRVEVRLDDGRVVLCPFLSLRKERADRGHRRPSRRPRLPASVTSEEG